MNLKPFEKSLWVSHTDADISNEYGEFLCEFDAAGSAVCRLSCHHDYALFLNGKHIDNGQFSDFDRFKTYDTIDLTPHLRSGKNVLAFLVWYSCGGTFRFGNEKAGLIFEIADENGRLLAASGEDTLARKSRAFVSGSDKLITPQLGSSLSYDATKEDGWRSGDKDGFSPAITSSTERFNFLPRPNKKHLLMPRTDWKIVKASKDRCYYLVDVGRETVGLFDVEFDSSETNEVTFTYGEHIVDGCVRRIIGKRDFSFEYVATPGHNRFTTYTLRLGCRYLELHSKHPVDLKYMGILPQVYPVKERPFKLESELDNRIYRLALDTLKLCMMEHYVDCPWREQALYALDSRNQMLCGYDAFEGGNCEYVRANLQLMGQDHREDGLLSICFPSDSPLTIPSFALHYFMSVNEYTKNSGDTSLACELYDKLCSVMKAFTNNMSDGLFLTFSGENHWNFYDWTRDLQGSLRRSTAVTHDLVLNSLAILALDALKEISVLINREFPYEGLAESVRVECKKLFFNESKMLFSMYDHREREVYNVMTNSVALLAEIVDGDTAEKVCANMLSDELIDCTLSLKVIKYNAMLKVNEEKYRAIILAEIRKEYGHMLDCGATSAWETIDGDAAFSNAGSLCHGWSAVPIHFFRRFGMVK